ncbi:tigger transposable element-derived protein 6-like [Crassostrea angulata]|uniref:tigger transposable element-derived protein 6-like n=1 Tax=Magallana angulata TaxID=2784310 RepID=UPI0022B09DF8|nr:tigger transposable element-derived protein 6-like [Crassostrea angulata]
MTVWKEKPNSLLTHYAPQDIFNADETGIFFRMLPDRTLEFKNVNCLGGKNKDRLTAMVCANMDGTENLPLLIIGKSANPRCFKNVLSFPVEYLANKKAWMTGVIAFLCKNPFPHCGPTIPPGTMI